MKQWGAGFLGLSLVLMLSFWSYNQSLHRQEPVIAEAGTVTGNPFTLSGLTASGKIKIYESQWGNPIIFKLKKDGEEKSYSVHNGSAITDVSVDSNSSVEVTVYFPGGTVKPAGWLTPESDNTRNCADLLEDFVAEAQDNSETIISKHCWNDDNEGDDPYDDFVSMFTITTSTASSPSPSPSPSASPSPGASPEPSPSLSPDQAQFVVTKFFDANRNGFKDSNEGGVNREWLFKVSQNADPYYDYTAESTGEGRIVTVGKGTKVTVEEVIQPGWVLTTDQVQTKNLTETRLYRFEFGNYNPALATTTGLAGTAQQPSTGTPTGLTAGLLAALPLLYFIRRHYASK